MKFYKCEKCGHIVYSLNEACANVKCCNEKMVELESNSVDAAVEKHVPVVTVKDNAVEVCVGSTLHPMSDVHNIAWVALETNCGVYLHNLNVNQEPKTTFLVAEGEVVKNVYAYCNLHGLWSIN